MAIKEVLLIGNPELRKKSNDINDFDKELNLIMQDLNDTLTYLQENKNIRRALAAPQIGYLKNVIYYQQPDLSFYMINPKIIWKSKQIINVWDSCFSFNVAFFVNIKRYKKIKIEFRDVNNKLVNKEYNNDLSKLFQHEIDHLNGILATDYLEDNHNLIMREEWERKYR